MFNVCKKIIAVVFIVIAMALLLLSIIVPILGAIVLHDASWLVLVLFSIVEVLLSWAFFEAAEGLWEGWL